MEKRERKCAVSRMTEQLEPRLALTITLPVLVFGAPEYAELALPADSSIIMAELAGLNQDGVADTSFAEPVRYPGGGESVLGTNSVRVADIDHDGDLDLITWCKLDCEYIDHVMARMTDAGGELISLNSEQARVVVQRTSSSHR